MLVLSRKKGEAIIFSYTGPDGKPVTVALQVVKIGPGDRTKLGVDADPGILVDRGEVHEQKLRDMQAAAQVVKERVKEQS